MVPIPVLSMASCQTCCQHNSGNIVGHQWPMDGILQPWKIIDIIPSPRSKVAQWFFCRIGRAARLVDSCTSALHRFYGGATFLDDAELFGARDRIRRRQVGKVGQAIFPGHHRGFNVARALSR